MTETEEDEYEYAICCRSECVAGTEGDHGNIQPTLSSGQVAAYAEGIYLHLHDVLSVIIIHDFMKLPPSVLT